LLCSVALGSFEGCTFVTIENVGVRDDLAS
jgi:hypothetical protein